MLADNPNAMLDKILSDIEIDEDDTRLPFLKQGFRDFAVAMVKEAGERVKVFTYPTTFGIQADFDKDSFDSLIAEINKPY